MNLYHLRYFVQLAHTRHYTRAAEQLCITQPSLSHAISQLENELGLPLFEKTGRNTELTRFGEQFLECAERTLSTLDEGVEELKRVSRGEGLIRDKRGRIGKFRRTLPERPDRREAVLSTPSLVTP